MKAAGTDPTPSPPSMPARRTSGYRPARPIGSAWPARSRGIAARTFRHSVYALAALPVDLFGLAAALSAGTASAGRAQRALARHLLGVPACDVPAREAARTRRLETRQVVCHSLAELPAALVSFGLAAPLWTVFVARGLLYPVFGAHHPERSWGGPSLAGAWAAHFAVGLTGVLVVSALLWPLSRYHARLAHRHWGA